MKTYAKSSKHWSTAFDIANKQKELKNLEKEMQNPHFWENKERAAALQKQFSKLQNEVESFVSLKKEASELSAAGQEQGKIALFAKKLQEKNLEVFLSGAHDQKPAILFVQAGAGGRDAEDWACLLFRMYQKYCDKKGWQHKIISQNFTQGGGPEGRIGLKEAQMEIKGKFSFGILKKESGIHRLVRISPFSAKQLRHTSFARVEVIPKISEEEIKKELVIKPEDLKVETFRSSGPGGQNVNRRETAVRITHLPTGLVAASQSERYQAVNKKNALEILAGKILQLKEEERQNEMAKLKGKKVSAAFGHQIRSYVFHPYNLVKDHRTEHETSNAQAVLDGELNGFIEAELYA